MFTFLYIKIKHQNMIHFLLFDKFGAFPALLGVLNGVHKCHFQAYTIFFKEAAKKTGVTPLK